MTLWDFENVMRSSLAHVLAELREHLPVSRCVDLTVDTMIEIRNTVAEEFKGKRVALEWIRLEALHADGVQHRYNAQPRIAAAQLTALEALSGPAIAHFGRRRKDYVEISVRGQVEVAP
jgi:hypothetical protein